MNGPADNMIAVRENDSSRFSVLSWIQLSGLVLLAYLLYQLDWKGVALLLGSIPPTRAVLCLGGAMVLFAIFIVLKTWRFCLILPDGAPRPWSSIFVAISTSNLLGLMTPGRFGDFARVWILESSGIGKSVTASIWLCERGLDLAAMLALALAVLAAIALGPFPLAAVGAAFLLILALLIVAGMTSGRTLAGWFGRHHQTYAPGSLARRAAEFSIHLGSAFRPRLSIILLTAICQLVCCVGFYLVAYTFIPDVTVVAAMSAYALSSLAVLLPVSIGGLGIREATVMGLFATYGISPEAACSVSLIDGTLLPLVVLSLLCGGGYLVRLLAKPHVAVVSGNTL
jgi:uncharacterized membrane protein YbhN (UPF0104 family)